MANLFLHIKIKLLTHGFSKHYGFGKQGTTGLKTFIDILKSNKKRLFSEAITSGLRNSCTFVRL